MKLAILTIMIVTISLGSAYSINSTLFDVRNEVFERSRKIKPGIADSRDAVLLGGMRDTCLMATNQLDAYFSMLGIFNTIDNESVTEESVNYLVDWLNRIKDTTTLSINELKSIPEEEVADEKTKIYMAKTVEVLTNLEAKVKEELNKISILKRSLGIR